MATGHKPDLCNVFFRSFVHANHCTLTCFPFFCFSPCESCRLQSSHHSLHSLFNVFTHPLMRPLTLESLFIYSSSLSHLPHFITSKKRSAFICVRLDCAIWRKVKPFQRSERYSSVGYFFMLLLFSSTWCTRICTTKSLNFCWIYI